MARLSRLALAGLLALGGASAHAFVFPSPPPGFGGTPGNWTFTPPTGTQQVGTIMKTSVSISTGGAVAKIPVALRYAPSAANVFAAAIYSHPALRTAVGIATLLSAAKIIWDESQKVWKKQTEIIEYGWNTASDGKSGISVTDPVQWCKTQNSGFGFTTPVAGNVDRGACYASGTQYIQLYRSKKIIQGEPLPVSEPEFTQAIINPANNPGWPSVPATWPMPATVPQELPQTLPIPVHLPVINPTADPEPQPQPYFVPQGQPLPNPTYNPNLPLSPDNQPFFIPGIRIVPSPTIDEPWRVDIQPVTRPTSSPVMPTPEQLNPVPQPGTNPDPNTQPKDKLKPEEQQSLCEKHPDILACQKLGEIEPKDLEKEDVNIVISPMAGWGEDKASCPAPKTFHIKNQAFDLSWQPVCDFALGLRPLVIAMAWLSAISMVVVVARRN